MLKGLSRQIRNYTSEERKAYVADQDSGETSGSCVSAHGKEANGYEEVADTVFMSRLCKVLSPNEMVMFIVTMGSALFVGALRPVLAVLLADTMTSVANPNSEALLDGVRKMAIRLCWFGLVQFLATFILVLGKDFFKERATNQLRLKYFEALIHQDMSWFDSVSTSAMPTRMAEHLIEVEDAVANHLMDTTAAGVTILNSFVAGFLRGWQLCLALSPIAFLCASGGIGASRALSNLKEQTWYKSAASMVEESLHCLRTVIALGGENTMIAEFAEKSNDVQQDGVRCITKIGFAIGCGRSMVTISCALGFWFGGLLVYHEVSKPDGGVYTLPDFMAVFTALLLAGMMASQMHARVKIGNKGQKALSQLLAVIDKVPDTRRIDVADAPWELQGIDKIEFINVEFSYPSRPKVRALAGMSLTILKGQRIALVGESGSGKSTLVALLERFYDADQGDVLINSQPIQRYSVKSLRGHIGYVGQEPVLFAGTVRENLLLGVQGTQYTVAYEEYMWSVLQQCDVDFVDPLPNKFEADIGSGHNRLSGGQKQRLAIARALIRSPSVLLLDEVTGAMDRRSEKMIQQTLDNLANTLSGRVAMLSIADRLSTICDCDCIFVLKQGAVVEFGTHQELVAYQGEYYALAASQQKSLVYGDDDDDDGSIDDTAVEASSPHGDITASSQASMDIQVHKPLEIAAKCTSPLRRLLSYNKPEWIYFIPSLVGAIGEGVVYPISLLFVDAMDALTSPGVEVDDQCLLLLLMALIYILCMGLMYWGTAMLGEAMTKRLRIALFTKMLGQEVGFLDDPDHAPYILSGCLRNYAYRAQVLVTMYINMSGAAISLVIGIVLALVSCWQVALILLGAASIACGCVAVDMQFSVDASKPKNMRAALQMVSDTLQNPRTVRATCTEKKIVDLFRKLLATEQTVQQQLWQGACKATAMSLIILAMAGAMYRGAELVLSGENDYCGVMKAVLCLINGAAGISMFTCNMTDLASAENAVNEMFELLDRRAYIDGLSDDIGKKPEDFDAGNIEFTNVCFKYPFRSAVTVLKSLSFKVSKGMHIGLVGPSGGGKSTVMSLLQRFYDPMSGEVLLGNEGINLKDVNVRWWRRQLGFVGQAPILFNTTVKENVLYGLPDGQRISDETLEECKQTSNLYFIDGSSGSEPGEGWATQVGMRSGLLPGSQRQCIAICRVLVRDPSVLCIDEATSGLDTASESIVQAALDKAVLGRTSLTIARCLSTVEKCDVILVIAEGTVLESGTHEELMDFDGVYTKLHMAEHNQKKPAEDVSRAMQAAILSEANCSVPQDMIQQREEDLSWQASPTVPIDRNVSLEQDLSNVSPVQRPRSQPEDLGMLGTSRLRSQPEDLGMVMSV